MELDESAADALGLQPFIVQLGLNLGSLLTFFRLYASKTTLAGVLVILGAVAITTQVVGQIAPYWARVTFAIILNAASWRLN